MKKPPDPHKLAALLRQRAEAASRQEAVPSPDASEALSPAEMRQTLHELRVHQIELEIQNEELRQAQAELDATRARYFDLYDLAPVSYITVNEPGLILEANLTAATLLGMPRGALVKQPLSRFILKEDQDFYYLQRKQLFQTGKPQACELRLVRKDGTMIWAHLAATAAEEDQGAPVARVVLSDITERKRREKEMELTARLILLVNTPGDFRDRMADLTAALQGWSGCAAVGIRLRAGDDYPYYATRGFPPAFVQAESRLCAQGPDGETLRDGAGHPVFECMCGKILSGRVDPAKPFFTAHGSFWTNSTTALLANTAEADCQARTRNRCHSEGYESVALIPLCAADEVFGLLQFNDHQSNRFTADLIAHFERIADSFAIALWRRQAEAETARAAREWQTTFDATNDAIWILDREHRVLRSNKTAERLFQRPCGKIIGQSCYAVVHGTAEPHPDCPFERARQSGRRETLEFHQGERVFAVTVDPILDAAGQFTGAVHIVSDITEKKQTEANFLRSQRLEGIGSLAGGIAHDLNNILSPVLLAAPFLREEKDERERNRLVDAVEGCAQRGADIIKQLLTFARGKPDARVPIPARLLLNEMSRLIRETFPRNIEVTFNPPKDLWSALGDTTQFHQALMNLCVNARDAMPGGGTLTLGARNANVAEGFAATALAARPGAYLCVSVADTGTGIAPENLPRIFDPFFTTKEVGKGTGLGLASLLGIVRGHEGFIRVASQPGNGTTFELYFPARPETAKEPEAPQRAEPPPRGQGELILIVDDEPAISRVVELTLKRYGYEVITAGGGEEALAIFTRQGAEIKAVITDMMMPGMDGPKLVRALRQRNAQLPILGMTGLVERVDLAALEGLNLAALLKKPFAAARMLVVLRRALDRGGNAPA